MSKPLHPIALFRLTVLGPLASRGSIKRGEVKAIIRELSAQTYNIPDSRRTHLSEETITRWYYDWKKSSIEGLIPKSRHDKGNTHLSPAVQEALLMAKQDNPARSINTLMDMIKRQGVVSKNKVTRAAVHRFLQQKKLSKRLLPDKQTIERRSFVAEHAGQIWQGDVLHGPSIQTPNGMRKTYLVSLMDDASRLITHSAFCLGETALDIEGVLKQAIIRRGIPYKLIFDNGAGYRSRSLQEICARLEIRLVFCRPYEPEAKGKIERFHRTFREQFLDEIDINAITGLDDINVRLWAWIDQVYHRRAHEGLNGKTPLERWQEDLVHLRLLGLKGEKINELFYHHYDRTVRNDGTISWEGKVFEVRYEHVGEKITLIVDPHTKTAVCIKSCFGDDLGPVTPLDLKANLNRKRQRPHNPPAQRIKQLKNSVELAYEDYNNLYRMNPTTNAIEEK